MNRRRTEFIEKYVTTNAATYTARSEQNIFK